MLNGNDYTSFMRDKKLRKNVNFYRDHYPPSKSNEKYPKLSEVFDQVSEMDGFQVESSDPEQQLCIEFSRTLFHLGDVGPYLESPKEEDGDNSFLMMKESEDEKNDDDSDGIVMDIVMENYKKTFGDDGNLNIGTGGDLSVKTLILSLFENVLCCHCHSPSPSLSKSTPSSFGALY